MFTNREKDVLELLCKGYTKHKMSEIDEDFYRQQLESAEMDKSLIDTITKLWKVYTRSFYLILCKFYCLKSSKYFINTIA